MTLEELGFDSSLRTAFAERPQDGFVPARIVSESRGLYLVKGEDVEAYGEPTGKFMFTADGPESMPAVGDWVVVSFVDNGGRAVIHELLPRRTMLIRKEAGKRSRGQIVASNVDTAFIVQGLDGDFNERRLERYCVVAAAGGVKPVILLSKRDLVSDDDLADMTARARAAAPGADIHAYSSETGEGITQIRTYVTVGATICFIGSSGAGKSTLVNRLFGEEIQKTREVRTADSRGRHVTVRRDMLFLPDGGILIDTPGMRELGLMGGGEGIDEAFPEIAETAENCRFRDCTHTTEPGCAVLSAVESGAIDPKRYESYVKLQREAEFIAMKQNEGVRAMKKKREKHYGRWLKEVYKFKGKS